MGCTDFEKKEALNSLFQSFIAGINNAKATAPRNYLNRIGLNYQKLYLGFNSGQFHHRKSDEFKKPYIELGLLKISSAPVRDPRMIGYTTFGDYAIIFPLRDESGSIVNMNAYRFKLQQPKSEYLNNKGIYPAYPKKRTTRVILTDNIIDAASLIQSDAMENRDAVIALKEGELTTNILKALRNLPDLEQIIIVSKNENESLKNRLKQEIIAGINCVSIPAESLNEYWLLHGTNGISGLIADIQPESATGFQIHANNEFSYSGQEINYRISGLIPKNPTLLVMDIELEIQGGEIMRTQLDLLNENQTKEKIYFLTEDKDLNCAKIIKELLEIKEELEKVRRIQSNHPKDRGFSSKQDKLAKHLLRSDDLFDQLDILIGKTGIVGNEKCRLLLYLIASSYKFHYKLHAVIDSIDQISSSDLIMKIAGLIPENEQYLIDITSSRSFRYYGNSVIHNKLIVIPDYSGITTSRAIDDLKRLQSKGNIINDIPIKGPDGFLNTIKQEVLGNCSSIGACSSSKKYFECEPRTVLVSIDNGSEQQQRLMEYDCQFLTGNNDAKSEEQVKELLQYVIRNIHSLEVVNPHATALMLPPSIKNARMLTSQLASFVSLITLFNQHKRDKNTKGKVIATIQDNELGIKLFLSSILLNIDDLDAGTRQFFGELKTIMIKCPDKRESKLSSIEIQKALNMSKSHANRFLSNLCMHDYIRREGHKNIGYTYSVTHWDDFDPIKQQILNKLEILTDPT